MIKTLALVFGAVFLLVGILGFIPAATPDHKLLGLFMVGGIHNVIHILSGALAIAGAMTSEKYAQLYFRVFGSVYALVTVVGFVQKDTVLGIFAVNTADNFLHLVLAVAILAVGFGVRLGTTGSGPARPAATV